MVSCLPGEAQTPAKQIFPAQEAPGPIMVSFRSSPPVHSSPTVFLIGSPPKSLGRFTRISTATYEPERSLENRFSIVMDHTPFVTESDMEVAQFWGGHLQLDGFGSTAGTQYVQFGPLGAARDFRPSSYDQAGLNRSVDLYGLSLRFDFGEPIGRPAQIWHGLGWIVGKGDSCPLSD
jgi:hypothetical protein